MVTNLIIFTVLTIVAIIAITLTLGGWLLSRAAGATRRFIGGVVGVPRHGQHHPRYLSRGTAMLRCPQPQCHAENPVAAKFCRRCGSMMNGHGIAREHVAVRRRSPTNPMW